VDWRYARARQPPPAPSSGRRLGAGAAGEPELFSLHKQSLWKPFLAGWLPAVVVLSGARGTILMRS
jgi:hypothetical protein